MASHSVSFTPSKEEIEVVRRHLDEIVLADAFRGSVRSQQFLRYIVEKTLEGDVSCLKERTIGVELFQRSPSYDTGQDAIVRVTASDVRRRLLEHYGRDGYTSHVHIQIPRGSYVPDIEIGVLAGPVEPAEKTARPVESAELPPSPKADPVAVTNVVPDRSRVWATVAIVATACLMLIVAREVWRYLAVPRPTSDFPPWSVILNAGHQTQIVTSDPNVEELQELIGHSISISDYANHRFIPDGTVPTADEGQFFRFYQHADNAAAVDTPLAVSIARLAPENLPIKIRSARSLHIAELQNDDNIILIGSPRSNPWVELFQDQLDFRFVFHQETNQEIIENVNPREHEQGQYSPTARGFATGESFALVALVHNANRSGRVLLLAGASGEGTEAAGHLVTDRDHLTRALQSCGVSTNGPVQDFELLLELRTLAGSPSATDIVACHILPNHK